MNISSEAYRLCSAENSPTVNDIYRYTIFIFARRPLRVRYAAIRWARLARGRAALSPIIGGKLYGTTKQGMAIVSMETSASDLERVALEIGALANKMLKTFRRIYSDFGFELEDGKNSCRRWSHFATPRSTSPNCQSESDAGEWQSAIRALLLVAELGGPTMFARIGLGTPYRRTTSDGRAP